MRNIRLLPLTLMTSLSLCTATVTAQPDFSGFGENFSINGESSTLLLDTGQIHIWDNVVVVTDLYKINCNDLMAAVEEKTLTATGEPLVLEMGAMRATAGHLYYNTETGEMELTAGEADAKPEIVQRAEDGSIVTFRADLITMGTDDEGQTIFNLNGGVDIDSDNSTAEEPNAKEPTAFDAPTIEIPAMGEGGQLRCDQLFYHTGEGRMLAEGNVEVNSEDLALQCDWLSYIESMDQIQATGEEVLVEKRNVEAISTQLFYTPETGRIVLDRLESTDRQPEVWHTREEGVFHALADQITVTQLDNGDARVTCSQNYTIENLPRTVGPESTPAPPEGPRRLDSIDLLPGVPIDPRA